MGRRGRYSPNFFTQVRAQFDISSEDSGISPMLFIVQNANTSLSIPIIHT